MVWKARPHVCCPLGSFSVVYLPTSRYFYGGTVGIRDIIPPVTMHCGNRGRFIQKHILSFKMPLQWNLNHMKKWFHWNDLEKKSYKNDLEVHDSYNNSNFLRFSKLPRSEEKSAGNLNCCKNRATSSCSYIILPQVIYELLK